MNWLSFSFSSCICLKSLNTATPPLPPFPLSRPGRVRHTDLSSPAVTIGSAAASEGSDRGVVSDSVMKSSKLQRNDTLLSRLFEQTEIYATYIISHDWNDSGNSFRPETANEYELHVLRCSPSSLLFCGALNQEWEPDTILQR
ncbi:hypothetical protein F4810DRAFT_133527 [Camillea tinctor]|nr:hypothetical protein F4810DRAFT_133527 [Camillea tinctor]